MEELFHRFFEPLTANGEGPTLMQTWMPRVDIAESDKEVVIKADLPGVEAKDVEVSVVDDALILKGERKEEKKEEKKNYHRVERFVGQFYREIPLPAGTDPEKITAATVKGVITVTIPKKAEATPKKITVKSND